jgi:hypothetical protein
MKRPKQPGASSLDQSFLPSHHPPKELPMHLTLPRRVFRMTLATSGDALATRPQAQALVDEKDAQAAAALGYVAEAKRVDVKKYPKFAAGREASR